MIKTISRAIYSAFITIVLITTILAGWTCISFISQPSKSGEIINVIQGIIQSQKSVIKEIIDLSKLLIKDTNERKDSENNSLFTESKFELPRDVEANIPLNEKLTLEDNDDNSLGIVIEPSLPEVSEKDTLETSLGPLYTERSEDSMN